MANSILLHLLCRLFFLLPAIVPLNPFIVTTYWLSVSLTVISSWFLVCMLFCWHLDIIILKLQESRSWLNFLFYLGFSDTVPGGELRMPIVTARWKQKSRLSSQPLSVSSWGRLPIAAEQARGILAPHVVCTDTSVKMTSLLLSSRKDLTPHSLSDTTSVERWGRLTIARESDSANSEWIFTKTTCGWGVETGHITV